LIARAVETVTWIKVSPLRFDLVGLVLGAIALTGLLVLLAMGFGGLFGFCLIARRRRQDVPAPSLHLSARP